MRRLQRAARMHAGPAVALHSAVSLRAPMLLPLSACILCNDSPLLFAPGVMLVSC